MNLNITVDFDRNNFTGEIYLYTKVAGDTYYFREILKRHDFYYNKWTGMWVRDFKYDKERAGEVLAELSKELSEYITSGKIFEDIFKDSEERLKKALHTPKEEVQ